MTDDVMSDCGGDDYIIETMSKNGEIGDTDFRKGMRPGKPQRHSNES